MRAAAKTRLAIDRLMCDRIRDIERSTPAPVDQAIDMMGFMSRASALFLQQPDVEKRRLLQIVVEKAAWKGGQLQTALFEPVDLAALEPGKL
jgi:hypothetical protein